MSSAPVAGTAAKVALQPFEALNRLNDMATAFMVSHTFVTACNLRIFEHLHSPMTAAQLAEKTGIHPDGCQRLMVALTHLGLVEVESGQYRNSELGSFLTTKSETPLEPLSMWGAPWSHMWEYLADALRELSPRWQQALGTTASEVFAALYEDPVRLRRFAEMMDAYSIPAGREIAKRNDFSNYHCIMDVAGGPGGMAIEIGRAHPHLKGMIMDLPQMCQIAEENIQKAGLGKRFRAVHADLFEGPYPTGADVLTLSWILHDWSDASCYKILRNCFAALPPGGTLLITESVLNNDHSGSRFAVLMSLHMAVVCESGAKERTEQEYRALV